MDLSLYSLPFHSFSIKLASIILQGLCWSWLHKQLKKKKKKWHPFDDAGYSVVAWRWQFSAVDVYCLVYWNEILTVFSCRCPLPSLLRSSQLAAWRKVNNNTSCFAVVVCQVFWEWGGAGTVSKGPCSGRCTFHRYERFMCLRYFTHSHEKLLSKCHSM